MFRIGHGIDIHRLKSGRKLKLGGVEIPFDKGLDGHSDADVILHAVSDALLGAVGLGDIGQHFPGDAKNKDRDSREILTEVIHKVWNEGYHVMNVDCTLLCEEPKISPYKQEMKKVMATLLNITPEQVNVKATTTEKLGYVGRSEGMECHAVVLLEKRSQR